MTASPDIRVSYAQVLQRAAGDAAAIQQMAREGLMSDHEAQARLEELGMEMVFCLPPQSRLGGEAIRCALEGEDC